MRGTVIKRGGGWSVVVEHGRDPMTGNRVRRWHSGFATKREAEKARTEILSRLDKGTYVEPNRRTVGTFLVDDWLPAIQSRLQASTFESYQRNVRLHVLPHLGSAPLQGLTPARLNAFYGKLLEDGRLDRRDGGLSPKTVRYIHGIIRKALADGARWNLVPRNVADLADPPRVGAGSTEMKTWTAAELRRFLAGLADDRYLAAWTLATTTGMRRGEVLGLRWKDVDLGAGRLAIRQTLVSVAYEPKLSTPKTPKSRRSVSLDPRTIAVLKAWRTQQVADRLAWGAGYADADLVFTREDGSPIHPERFTQMFDKHVKSSGLPRIRLHTSGTPMQRWRCQPTSTRRW